MSQQSLKAFVCYSHEDGLPWVTALGDPCGNGQTGNGFVDALVKSLGKVGYPLDCWVDRHLPGGLRWAGELRDKIDCCNVAIVLITPGLIRSNHVATVELPAILRRHDQQRMIVFPILAIQVDWDHCGYLAPLAALQILPAKDRDLASAHGTDRWANLIGEVRDGIARLFPALHPGRVRRLVALLRRQTLVPLWAVAACCAVWLATLLVAVMPPFPVPSGAVSTDHATVQHPPSLPPCALTANTPVAGAPVGASGLVAGDARIPDGGHLWVLMHPPVAGSQWWPQDPASFRAPGSWSTIAYFGSKDDIGKDFEIAVVIVNQAANDSFEDWLRRGRETKRFDPVGYPLTGDLVPGCPSAHVVVKKVSH